MNAVLEAVLTGSTLDPSTAGEVVHGVAEGEVDPILAGALLAALRMRGETSDELLGLARALRERAIGVEVPADGAPLVDTAGTGGDGAHSLNLSTAAALVAAAAGARVVKHGNRAISSRSGSADVLEAAGLTLHASPEDAVDQLDAHGFTFLFAPNHHPAMARIAPVRRALGVRTAFNLLGPLVNPARPPHQVVGVAREVDGERIATVLRDLGVTRAIVVHGALGWDEATTLGPYVRWDVRPDGVERRTEDPAALGLPPGDVEALKGGDPADNARRLVAVVRGGEHGTHRDTVLLGAALALEACGLARDTAEGLERAAAALDAGNGERLLSGLGVRDA